MPGSYRCIWIASSTNPRQVSSNYLFSPDFTDHFRETVSCIGSPKFFIAELQSLRRILVKIENFKKLIGNRVRLLPDHVDCLKVAG